MNLWGQHSTLSVLLSLGFDRRPSDWAVFCLPCDTFDCFPILTISGWIFLSAEINTHTYIQTHIHWVQMCTGKSFCQQRTSISSPGIRGINDTSLFLHHGLHQHTNTTTTTQTHKHLHTNTQTPTHKHHHYYTNTQTSTHKHHHYYTNTQTPLLHQHINTNTQTLLPHEKTCFYSSTGEMSQSHAQSHAQSHTNWTLRLAIWAILLFEDDTAAVLQHTENITKLNYFA